MEGRRREGEKGTTKRHRAAGKLLITEWFTLDSEEEVEQLVTRKHEVASYRRELIFHRSPAYQFLQTFHFFYLAMP
jgi:hypothetical protein